MNDTSAQVEAVCREVAAWREVAEERGIGANPYQCIFRLADADQLLLEWPTARALTSSRTWVGQVLIAG